MASTRPAFVALFLAFSGFSLVPPSRAQNSPADYLAPHNAARAAVGVGPLVWDANLEDYAKNYAEERSGDCKLIHSGGEYGENLFRGRGRPYNAADALGAWVNEKQYYDYPSNSCVEGKVCGHYTQVVWADTKSVGCSRLQCDNGYYFIICSYDPPGNWEGEWPYGQSSVSVSS